MKTSELKDQALDWAVGHTLGIDAQLSKTGCLVFDAYTFTQISIDSDIRWAEFAPSRNWNQAGPIIERELIHVTHSYSRGDWKAYIANDGRDYYGPTPLIAAMRCYVASKLDDDIDVPEELK